MNTALDSDISGRSKDDGKITIVIEVFEGIL